MRRAVTACLLGVVGTAAVAVGPVAAHSGGRAQLYVDSVRLDPAAAGWQATLHLRDADSGRTEPGFGVHVTATTPAVAPTASVPLADPDATGRYSGLLPLAEGPWILTIEATELPGGPRAIPFRKAWPVRLIAGQPVEVTGRRPGGPGHSGTVRLVPLLVATLAAAALSSLLTARIRRRQARLRPAADQRAQPRRQAL